jgi:hypothetical protein
MSGPSPEVRALAQSILRTATAGCATPEQRAAAVESACGLLQQEMALLVGAEGFRALMKRAVHLTRRECPCIELAPGDGGGTVLSTSALLTDAASPELRCSALLFSHVIDLFSRFIGQALTNRVLSRIWPTLFAEPALDGQEGQREEPE